MKLYYTTEARIQDAIWLAEARRKQRGYSDYDAARQASWELARDSHEQAELTTAVCAHFDKRA